MEISSTQSTQYSTQNNVSKKIEANEPFEIPKEEVLPQEKKNFQSAYLNYWGANSLNGFSKEKQKLYETILSDNKITMDEIKDLNFKETKDLLTFVRSAPTGTTNKDEIFNMPFVQLEYPMDHMHGASIYTTDETFNEAYFNTLKDPMFDKKDKDNLYYEMQNNLTQMFGNERMQVSRVQGGGAKGDLTLIFGDDRKEMNSQAFFDKVFTILSNYIDNPNINASLKEYSSNLQTLYKSIEDNYKEIEERNNATTTNNSNPYFNMEYRQ